MSSVRVTFASMGRGGVSGANPPRMPPPTSHLANLLLLLLLPRISISSFSSTLDEVKESLLEREGLRSLASFLSFDPEDTEDVEEATLSMSSSRYIIETVLIFA